MSVVRLHCKLIAKQNVKTFDTFFEIDLGLICFLVIWKAIEYQFDYDIETNLTIIDKTMCRIISKTA